MLEPLIPFFDHKHATYSMPSVLTLKPLEHIKNKNFKTLNEPSYNIPSSFNNQSCQRLAYHGKCKTCENAITTVFAIKKRAFSGDEKRVDSGFVYVKEEGSASSQMCASCSHLFHAWHPSISTPKVTSGADQVTQCAIVFKDHHLDFYQGSS